jgi:hypothetical protein
LRVQTKLIRKRRTLDKEEAKAKMKYLIGGEAVSCRVWIQNDVKSIKIFKNIN